MAKKKVGDLIKEARTNAGLTQEQLAKQVENVTASDISKAERGEKALTQAALKQIAKATGVTQKSLLEAPTGATAAKKTSGTTDAKKTGTSTDAKKTGSSTSSKKTGTSTESKKTGSSTSSKKTGTSTDAKKTGSSTSSKKTGATSGSKKTTSSSDAVKLTAAEKRIIELYRKADADTKKEVEALLKGEKEDGDLVGTLLGGAMELFGNLGK